MFFTAVDTAPTGHVQVHHRQVVEEDRRMLLTNELESIALPDGTTQTLDPAAPDTFANRYFHGPLSVGKR